jgi:hypothetical protein
MQIVENEVISHKTIVLDDKHFVNCTYDQCTVVYNGGEYALTNTSFKNCPITLAGAAQRTAMLLTTMGVLPPATLGAAPNKPNGPVQ